MKLLICMECGDIIRLFSEKRHCKCGRSWGHYLDDQITAVQTSNAYSLGIANPDLRKALEVFAANPDDFSPMLSVRAWINPVSGPEIRYVDPPEADSAGS